MDVRKSTLCFLLLLCSIASGQQRIDKKFAVGDLGFLEHPEPCAWLTFDDVTWVQEASGKVYFATKPGKFKIAAMSTTEANKVLAFYLVTVGAGPDIPPGPGPQPIPPDPQPQPTTWQQQIAAATAALPAATKARAGQVADVFDQVAKRCGSDLFTAGDIRTATQTGLASIQGFADWSEWDRSRIDADAKWSREAFRDSIAFKARWLETAAGVRSVAPPQAAPQVIRGEMVQLRAQFHQERNGRLLEYVCPQNGQRCRWADRGQIVERGAGWVVVQ